MLVYFNLISGEAGMYPFDTVSIPGKITVVYSDIATGG
jgi:hypothetical protein